ncbi:MAG TPA: hypothetical protein VEI04_05060 [Syntrophobacteria bacterium]|nr:hypothetical protein [Syntrophobacteria bacterium]
MKKQVGLAALAVLAAFAIGFAPGLARADSKEVSYAGMLNIRGTVESTQSGYALKTADGTFRLAGADASKASELVGRKVKAWGELYKDNATDLTTLDVYHFAPAKA